MIKRLFFILFLLTSVFVLSAQNIHSFADKSVLANGKFTKIRIVQSGVYRLISSDLSSMGLTTDNVRIFGYGGNILEQSFLLPMIDDLPEIAIHREKDYILFYANGIDKWTYDNNQGLFTHQPNTYSSFAYYFVTANAGVGRKIETAQAVVVPQNAEIKEIDTFTDYQIYNKEAISIAQTGKTFYSDKFENTSTLNINFISPNTVATQSVIVQLDVAASGEQSSFTLLPKNSLENQSRTVNMWATTSVYEKARGIKQTFFFTPQGDNLNFELTYNKNGNSIGYLNYLSINTIRQLKMNGAAMRFQNLDNIGKNVFNKYKLSDASSNIRIWDITDTENIVQMPAVNESGIMAFTASAAELRKYMAVDLSKASQFPKPETVGTVPNQNLHKLSATDFVIITHPDFMQQAERLAQFHRETDKMRVAVVTTEQVYNEFSSGAPDATAYRRFLKMFYNRAENEADKPKYLLLFGSGSYDNRKINSTTNSNFILTYQADNSLVITSSFVTDDYFAMLDDDEGVETPFGFYGDLDVGVGRFPVRNKTEAEDAVNKTINYKKNTEKGIWKNQLCFVADDGDRNIHMRDADYNAEDVQRDYPAYQISKIYLDAYQRETNASGYTYPMAHTSLLDQIRKGLFFLNYTGHAGTDSWTYEQVLTKKDVNELTNIKRLPLWVTVSCSFIEFDNDNVSAGERVFLNPNGGGIGMIAATRLVYSSPNYVFNKYFCANMFKQNDGAHYRLGDLMRITKNSIGREINKLCYVLMGDPALTLNYPTKYSIRTDSINGHLQTGNDTIRALSITTLAGTIIDGNGAKVKNFNGKLTFTIYDKKQRITTLDNNGDGVFYFNTWSNRLFSGTTSVVNGEYSFTFMLPLDIIENYGQGRINYYANDTITNAEAQGWFENFTVGGIIDNIKEDNKGPKIKLFLNTFNFKNGDKVNESPLLIAVLEDINGINTADNDTEHNLLMIIDDDASKSIILNNFYEADRNSYQRGIVRYKLPELEDGKHTLSLRAWDLLNNSNTARIEFETVRGLRPQIFSVSNFPNPVKQGETTRIVVSHDRPETVLNTTIDIFDTSGRLIRTFAQTNADDVVWDMTGGNGMRVRGGVYIYRVTVKTKNSDTYFKSNKILVVE